MSMSSTSSRPVAASTRSDPNPDSPNKSFLTLRETETPFRAANSRCIWSSRWRSTIVRGAVVPLASPNTCSVLLRLPDDSAVAATTSNSYDCLAVGSLIRNAWTSPIGRPNVSLVAYLETHARHIASKCGPTIWDRNVGCASSHTRRGVPVFERCLVTAGDQLVERTIGSATRNTGFCATSRSSSRVMKPADTNTPSG